VQVVITPDMAETFALSLYLNTDLFSDIKKYAEDNAEEFADFVAERRRKKNAS